MLNLNPFLNTADAGGGGNSAAGSQGAGGQQGNQGAQSQGGGTGSQSAAAVAYADDLPISHEGKTMTMKEFIASRTAGEVENARKMTRSEIEGNLRKLAHTLQQQQRQPHGQQQRVDPLAGVRDQPILSGQQLAQALDGTLGPVAQAVAQLQQQNQALSAQVKKLTGGVTGIARERNSQARTSRVSQAISALGEGYDAKDPFLNDVAQDILDAWEFDKPEEFGQMLGARVKAMEKFFTAKQQADLKRAKERRFTRPGGGASPNGQARMDPRKWPAQAADILFGASNSSRT